MIENYILLVEDNPDEVVLTQRAFNKCQIFNKLVVVCDGREALEFLFSQGQYSDRDLNEKPLFILLDLNLPVVSGLKVLEAIRSTQSASTIPVIVMTSSSEERDRSESNRLGASQFIRKPTGFAQFVEIIQQIKSLWLEPT